MDQVRHVPLVRSGLIQIAPILPPLKPSEARECRREAGKIEAEAKVDQLRKAISTNLSHELRTPLGQIMMSLQTVIRQRAAENPSNDVDSSIQAALNSADKLKQLVNDLIILHTIDAGELSTFRQAIDINYEIRLPIEKRAQAWNKNLTVEFGIHPDLRIYAPRLEFTQAITHLIDNAAKISTVAPEAVF